MSLSSNNGNNNLPPDQPPVVSEYTQHEMQKLWNMVLTNVESLKEIKLILDLETKNILLPTNKDTPRPEGNYKQLQINEEEIEATKNIRFIAPNINAEFDKIRNKTMKIGDIMQYYNRWIENLYSTVLLNKGKIKKNKKLRIHIQNAYCICDTLNRILDNHMKKQD